MEIMKRGMRATHDLGRVTTQITLEDDFNVPDVKPDIVKLLKSTGEVLIDSQQSMDGKLLFSGKLLFKFLYVTGQSQSPVACMKGEIPFSESMYLPDGADTAADIHIDTQIEDLSVGIINSRKVSVNSILSIALTVMCTRAEEPVIGIAFDNEAQYMTKPVKLTSLAASHKDILRIKDEIELSSNKPNISEVIWSEWQSGSFDCRPMDEKLSVKGELKLFMIYSADDENGSLQWSEHTVPYSGEVSVSGLNEMLYPYIRYNLINKEPEIKADDDGEMRLIAVDETVELDMVFYEENTQEVISDVYSALVNLEPEEKKVKGLELLARNTSKCRVSDKLRVSDTNPHILQICNSSASVKIDNTSIVDGGISVEGIVVVSLLYIALDDKQPLYESEGIIPFTHKIEVRDIDEACVYNIFGNVEQLNAVMVSSEEVECKAAVVLDAIVFKEKDENIITNISEKPYDNVKIAAMPGIVGYVVKPGDTLWKIAKEFYTTVENIKEINGLGEDGLKPGDKLVLMKKVASASANASNAAVV